MTYLSQIFVFLLALLGTFFKCVKEDRDGKIITWRRTGLPTPTRCPVSSL
jgi:hypothetical protein